MKPQYPKYVRPSIAGDMLDVSTQTLRKWAKAGKIGFMVLPNGHYRYNVAGMIGAMTAPPRPAKLEPIGKSPEVKTVTVTPQKPVQAPSVTEADLAAALAALAPKQRPAMPDGVELRDVDDGPEIELRDPEAPRKPSPAPAAKAPPKKVAKPKPMGAEELARQLEAMQSASG